jgi:hypothetical protein
MPFWIVAFSTPLPLSEVESRLRPLIKQPDPAFSFRQPELGGPPFQGSFDPPHFKVSRRIRYRNSFLPVIHGSLRTGSVGSEVRLVMHLHFLVLAFMCVWFGGVLSAVSLSDFAWDELHLLPLGMAVFGVVLTCGGFFPEAVKAARLLREAVGAA